MEHRQPALAADCVVFDPQGRLLLIRRKNPPFQGQYALPGGFVDYGETTEQARRASSPRRPGSPRYRSR
jgi:8-oxo-dGTP diphosphatase